jgi:LytS/YehU family sensor histidine kinase
MGAIPRFLSINFGISALVAVLTYANMRHPRWDVIAVAGGISFVFANLTGGLAWTILPRVGRFVRGPKWWTWTQLILLLALIGVCGGTIGTFLLRAQPFYPLRINYWESISANIVFTVLIGVISTFSEVARRQLEETSLELRTKELERANALKAASEARLQSLESRVHPHFLFNTLNSISSLVRQDPAAAEELIQRLAALLRFSLDRHASLVSLEEELQITLDYLEIEKARFQDRLRYEVAVPSALLGVRVPGLSLQTLVENSVKYAVAASRQGATILIEAREGNGGVRLEVRDDGPGFAAKPMPEGHGLDTLRQRLEAFFGASATLEIETLSPGMAVSFLIPC